MAISFMKSKELANVTRHLFGWGLGMRLGMRLQRMHEVCEPWFGDVWFGNEAIDGCVVWE